MVGVAVAWCGCVIDALLPIEMPVSHLHGVEITFLLLIHLDALWHHYDCGGVRCVTRSLIIIIRSIMLTIAVYCR